VAGGCATRRLFWYTAVVVITIWFVAIAALVGVSSRSRSLQTAAVCVLLVPMFALLVCLGYQKYTREGLPKNPGCEIVTVTRDVVTSGLVAARDPEDIEASTDLIFIPGQNNNNDENETAALIATESMM
jgi:hypothetical protein